MGLVSQSKRDSLGHPTLSSTIYPCNLRCGSGVPTNCPACHVLVGRLSSFGSESLLFCLFEIIYVQQFDLMGEPNSEMF